jgi:hypothetical protein
MLANQVPKQAAIQQHKKTYLFGSRRYSRFPYPNLVPSVSQQLQQLLLQLHMQPWEPRKADATPTTLLLLLYAFGGCYAGEACRSCCDQQHV